MTAAFTRPPPVSLIRSTDETLNQLGGDDGSVLLFALGTKPVLRAEEILMLAVMWQTLSDLTLLPSGELAHGEARFWLDSPADDWPFAFEAICQHFNWDADAIRSRLLDPKRRAVA